MASPYDNLPQRAFWRNCVTDRDALEPGDVYHPGFRITRKTRMITVGSCFARHIGRALSSEGYNLFDGEPLHCSVPDVVAQRHGYRLFSARYGNIYTVRQLLQLLQQAFGERSDEAIIWQRDGRYFDALRPMVEPDGLPAAEDVAAHRAQHLAAVREVFTDAHVMVYTLGLTEAWIDSRCGTVYPVAPGIVAGDWDPETVKFHNFSYPEMLRDFVSMRELLRQHSPRIRMILTVSPVPLTATASGHSAEVATAYSKGALRALCGQLYDTHRSIDYFPSYEIITSAAARGAYFSPNLRSVSAKGVQAAMSVFFGAHNRDQKPYSGQVQLPGRNSEVPPEDFCEDALLEAFR